MWKNANEQGIDLLGKFSRNFKHTPPPFPQFKNTNGKQLKSTALFTVP